MGDDQPRRIGLGEMPSRVVLSVTEAFDIAEALEAAQALADEHQAIETGLRAATALSIIWNALGVV